MSEIASLIAVFLTMFSGLVPFEREVVRYTADALRPPVPHARILFVGDMMFDRSIRRVIDEKGGDFIFSCVDPILKPQDLVVGNLEGPITDNPSVSLASEPGDLNNFTFTFDPIVAPLLYAHNIRMVNLGNNHIMNFSRDGLVQTKKYLDAANVAHFGDPAAVEEERVARFEIRSIPISIVNWSDWTSDKTDHTVAQVRKEAESGRVVFVYTHWGEEYVAPSERTRKLAHSFIDAGAQMVIGTHPHVVLEHEVYKGKDIYYSIGNFIFDQYWMESVRNGLALEVYFTQNNAISIKEIPVELMRDRRTCPKPEGETVGDL